MPMAIGAVATALGALATGTTVFGLSVGASAFLLGAGSFALSYLQQAMMPKPKGLSKKAFSQGQTTQFRQAITSQKILVGDVRTGGPIVFATCTGDNKFLHMIIAMAGHKVRAIGEVWLEAESIPLDYLDETGMVIRGTFAGKVRIKKLLGESGQAADPDLLAEVPEWTEDCRLRGIAGLYIRYEYDADVFPNGGPNASAWVQGVEPYDPRTGTAYWTPNGALVVHHYMTNARYGIGSSNVDETYTSAAANISDEIVETTAEDTAITRIDLATEIETVTAGKDTLKLKEIKFSYARRQAVTLTTTDTAPGGLTAGTTYYIIPTETYGTVKLAATDEDAIAGTAINITNGGVGTHTLTKPSTSIITLDGDTLPVVTGDRVELVTDGTAPAGLAEDTDYYAIVWQRTGMPRLQLATTLDNAYAGSAISITDAGSGIHVIRKTGEPRYRCCGIIDTAEELGANLNELRSSIAGDVMYIGGSWKIIAGAYRTPTITLDHSHLRRPLKIVTKTSIRNRFNTVKGLYASPFNNGQGADYPAVKNATYKEQDGGQEQIADYDLPYTPTPKGAQRIAKIKLEKARQELVLDFPANLSALRLQCGDTVMLNLPRYGFSSKVFEIKRWKLAIEDGEGETPSVGIDLQLQETASAVYDWNSGEETNHDLSPNTNLPNFRTVKAVTGLSVDSELVETTAGDSVYKILARWDPITDLFVSSGGMVEIQFKKASDTDWRPTYTVPASFTFAEVSLAAKINDTYDLRVRAVNKLQAKSGWTTILNVMVGSSGGVGTSLDWGNWTEGVGANEDWGNWTDAVGTENDWGFYT